MDTIRALSFMHISKNLFHLKIYFMKLRTESTSGLVIIRPDTAFIQADHPHKPSCTQTPTQMYPDEVNQLKFD